MVPIEVLWCPNQRTERSNRWSFPPKVRKLLESLSEGKSVVHLFGGLSTFGVKLDIDRETRPHVIGDAWLPPFKKNAFDICILDPPYFSINQQMKTQLLMQAAYIAHTVYWFHTIWIANGCGARCSRAWLVRVGDSCHVRCLQEFIVQSEKATPVPFFSRGPAMKYNRWLNGAQGLPFIHPD